MKIAWSPLYAQPLPEGHRFPMEKYLLLPEQLLYEGTIKESQLFCPARASLSDFEHTHTVEYLEKLKNLTLSPQEIRKTGFPLSTSLIDREVLIMQGTIEAAQYALKDGISMNIAGGTHHAFSDRGEGFCILNDQAIAAKQLLIEKKVRKVLIVDLDVHQGNGTAAIFKNQSEVFTFSMHGDKNYPMHKEKSDLDVPLTDGIGDTEYLLLLDRYLPGLMENIQPDFVFYQCGVDVLASDKLGRLKLSKEACKQRDYKVMSLCKRNRIPLVCSMGGGYSEQIKDIVEAHANTFRLAMEMYF